MSRSAPKSAPKAAASSRDRLLDAGEAQFADHGYNGVSLREIADAAGVNVGTIPYFFGTKENLFKEVLQRRVLPIQTERRDRLNALLAEPETMTLETVLAAFLEPVFKESAQHEAFRKLAARCATDPAPEVRRTMDDLYDAANLLTPKALRMVCAELPDKEFYWRLSCLYGAMFYIQADTGRMQTISNGVFEGMEVEAAKLYLIPAFAALFRAPAAE